MHYYNTWQIDNSFIWDSGFLLSRGKKQFIAVGKCSTRWVNDEKQGSITFSQSSQNKVAKYLLNNCCLFANTFRFINDWTVLHDGDEIEKSFREVHPPDLKFKKENDSNFVGCFLDLCIKIKDN